MNHINALTIDVEDYFQVSGFEASVARADWDRYESRVEANTRRLLALLDAHDCKATFFVLGWTAERFADLVRDIRAAGHEVGSHSYWHRLIYQMTPDEFRDDLRRSRDVIEDAVGERVTAFRAPSFSITSQSLWALEILVEEGFEVDSSIFPVRHDRYGIPGAKTSMHTIETGAGPLVEFPMSATRIAGYNLPISGGGYFRLYPFAWTRHCLDRINRRENRPFVFYLHPWEIDPDQPRLPIASRMSRFRHYVNLASTEGKLGRLLRQFRFGRLCDLARAPAPQTTVPIHETAP